ncbi:hypothetical protein FZEAL_9043 [Fusarium zealandicum]|uniref:F-box domain-containing protein n=1 Tax=Fusarium zealandicum TaxID=1053134 RepID=A0A8H4UDN3_9HYPO|nr:hypothetical protein FZEAL_9043 [Fusarium zealandicum]
MASSLLQNLPVVLVTEIAQWLPFQDKTSFSSASWAIRNILSPKLFRTIRITCPVSADQDVDIFLEKYSTYISHVYLYIPLHPNLHGSDEEESDTKNGHPSIWGETPEISDRIKRIVGGQALPGYSTVSIEFDPGQFEAEGEWDDEGIGSIHCFSEPEEWDEVETAEKTYTWRAQCAEVWRGIAANPNIRQLDIINLLPRNTQAWKTDEWADFVGRLHELNISIFGSDNGAGWKAHRMIGFEAFLSELADHFTRHANQVKRLTIAGNEDGMIGSVDLLAAPLPLKTNMLPELYYLRLENAALDFDLFDFLEDHGDSLKELHIRNCISASFENNGPPWVDLWNHVRKVSTALTKLTVTEGNCLPLTEEEEFGDPPKSPELEQVRDIRKRLQQDQGLRLWRYAEVDEKYGLILERSEQVIAHFEQDSEAFNALLDVVNKRQ